MGKFVMISPNKYQLNFAHQFLVSISEHSCRIKLTPLIDRHVSDLLVYPAAKVHIGYPGYGSTPPKSDVNGFDDLVAKITSEN